MGVSWGKQSERMTDGGVILGVWWQYGITKKCIFRGRRWILLIWGWWFWEAVTILHHSCTSRPAPRSWEDLLENCPTSIYDSNPAMTLKASAQVNLAKAQGYLFANLSFTLVAFVINLWAGICILRKERTGIHKLIVCDCVVNVASSLHTAFHQSPWSMLGSPIPCLANVFLLHLLITWNRLVPIVLLVFLHFVCCLCVF